MSDTPDVPERAMPMWDFWVVVGMAVILISLYVWAAR